LDFLDDFAAFPTVFPVRIVRAEPWSASLLAATRCCTPNQQRLCHGHGSPVRTNEELRVHGALAVQLQQVGNATSRKHHSIGQGRNAERPSERVTVVRAQY
jgi:hypothetical protein